MTRLPFVSFLSLIFVGFPSIEPGRGALHGSVLPDVCGAVVKVGITNGSSVGEGIGVSVGSGVAVGVSVGGTGVLVGMAACVSATIVNAAATAVCCISSALTVGSAGCAAHAFTRRLKINKPAQI
ncbi:MAG TPA: hypothetical protein DCX53_02290 [Anaerolineae bacterium]|nr:hypothetical protein [Anaerolineae bacterium]